MTAEAIKNRYDFMFFFDVENGNPNGDPDAGNMPRIDPETGYGIITDVCLKRKIRNYVEDVKGDAPGYRIYIKQGVPLNRSDNEAFETIGISNAADNSKLTDEVKKAKERLKKEGKSDDVDKIIRDYMCSQFYDIRTFGAVMTTMTKGALNCGQVRGPVQLSFGRSIDPVVSQTISITRLTLSTEKEAAEKRNTMGVKYIIPYGLYRCEGYVSANLASKTTGFSEEDLQLLWDAIVNMFDFDHSAARGSMVTRKLIIFKHESLLGNAPAHKLFDLVTVARKEGVVSPRSYSDYTININTEALPSGVEVIQKD